MSFSLLRHTERQARKARRCIWCPEPIAKGEIYVAEAAIFDGDFQHHDFHPECLKACQAEARAEGGECIIDPHRCARGSQEEWQPPHAERAQRKGAR